MKKISIIIPVYNTEKYIDRCLESVTNQTYKNLEIIIVNDGSKDNALSKCEEWSKKDSRIKVLSKENGGLSSARNFGIIHSTGDYIGFVDSDDFISYDMYETLYNMIEKNDVDVSRVEYKEVNEYKKYKNKKNRRSKVFRGQNEILDAFLKYRFESVCVSLYKRECIKDIKFEIGKTSEDLPFNFEVMKNINSLSYSKIKKYYYYNNPLSISNGNLTKNKLNYIIFREKIDTEINKLNNVKLAKKSKILCTRAYMATLLRMCIYGVDNSLNEKDILNEYMPKFKKNFGKFIFSSMIPLSRKLIGTLLYIDYNFLKKILKRNKND